jgi:hypothetical protein
MIEFNTNLFSIQPLYMESQQVSWFDVLDKESNKNRNRIKRVIINKAPCTFEWFEQWSN